MTILNDDKLVSPGNRTNAEGATISLQIKGNSPTFSTNGGTFLATNLPPGLTIDSTTGLISGRINYKAFEAQLGGAYDVTVSLRDSADQTISFTSFEWTINNRAIGTFTLTEVSSSGNVFSAPDGSPLHQVTTDEFGNAEIWIAPGNKVRMSVSPPVGGQLPLSTDIRFLSSGTPGAGNLGTTSVILPDPVNDTYVILGIDEDLDGTLDFFSESSFRITTRMLSLTGTNIQAQLPSDYLNECSYVNASSIPNSLGNLSPLKALVDEALYQLQLIGSSIGDSSLIRWQLFTVTYPTAGGTVANFVLVDSGAGTTVNHKFDVSDEHLWRLEFYIDVNGNNARGLLEPSMSRDFAVAQPRKELWQCRLDTANDRYSSYEFYESFRIGPFIQSLKLATEDYNFTSHLGYAEATTHVPSKTIFVTNVRTLGEATVLHESLHALEGKEGNLGLYDLAGQEGLGYSIQYIWSTVIPQGLAKFEDLLKNPQLTADEVNDAWWDLAGALNRLFTNNSPVYVLGIQWRSVEPEDVELLQKDGFKIHLLNSGLIAKYQSVIDELGLVYTFDVFNISPTRPVGNPRTFNDVYWQ